MKHLFNDIPKSEKQRILEMHGVKRKLVSESSEMMEKGEKLFNSLSEPEKMKLGKAIKECLKEHHNGTIAGLGLAASVAAIGGVYLMVKNFGVDIISLASGAMTVGFLGLEIEKVKEIIDCVKSKMNDTTDTPMQEPMQEQSVSGTTPTQTKKVKISLVNPDGSEKILWDGNKVVDTETTIRVLKREMNYKNPTKETMSSNLNNILVYINARIREGGGTEFGEKYKVQSV